MERTLVIIKPCALQRGLTEEQCPFSEESLNELFGKAEK